MEWKRADAVEVGDRVIGPSPIKGVVTESRVYLPNPEAMWLLHIPGTQGYFTRRSTRIPVEPRLIISEIPWEGI